MVVCGLFTLVIIPPLSNLGKDGNAKFKVQFLLNVHHSCTTAQSIMSQTAVGWDLCIARTRLGRGTGVAWEEEITMLFSCHVRVYLCFWRAQEVKG